MNYFNFPPSRTSRQILKQFGTHLFYAEGTKTEPKYVKDMKNIIKQRYKMTASDIIIVDDKSGGRSTLGLIEYAENDVAIRVKKNEKIDHVWIFYDKDSFEKDSYDNSFHKVTSKNKKKFKNDDGDNCDSNNIRWHALWSNECFELWVLLHFEYIDACLPRTGYIPRIDKILDDKQKGLSYEKKMLNLYQILEKYGSIKNAVRRSIKLNDSLPNVNEKTNPSTGIYDLMDFFHAYLQIEI